MKRSVQGPCAFPGQLEPQAPPRSGLSPLGTTGAEESWGAQGDVYGSPDCSPPPLHPGTALPGGRQEGNLASTSRSGAELRKSLGTWGEMRGGKTPGAQDESVRRKGPEGSSPICPCWPWPL